MHYKYYSLRRTPQGASLAFLHYIYETVRMGRPATGQTPGHTVRIPGPVWDAAEARVGKRHMAALITRLLERDNAAAVRKAKREAERADDDPT